MGEVYFIKELNELDSNYVSEGVCLNFKRYSYNIFGIESE